MYIGCADVPLTRLSLRSLYSPSRALLRSLIDSLNYFHMPLSSLPKAYGLNEIEKGVFPHLFNTPENQSYEGPFPPLNVYSPDSMKIKERTFFGVV